MGAKAAAVSASTSSKHEVFMNVYSGSGGRSCVELAAQAVFGRIGDWYCRNQLPNT